MNEEQLISLKNTLRKEPELFCIRSHEFTRDNKPRTLLYGYYLDRTDFHVYLYDRHVYKVSNFAPGGYTRWFNSLEEFAPDKRLYPEACDYDFCKYLKQHGIALPFTTFSNARTPQQFYGKVPQLELAVRV